MTHRPSLSAEPADGWFKSSYSGGGGNECVEVRRDLTGVGVRDSEDPSGPVLTFTRDEFAAFITDLAADRLKP